MKKRLLKLLFALTLPLMAHADCDPTLTSPTNTTRTGLTQLQVNACNWGTVTNNNWAIIDSSAAILSQQNTFSGANTFNGGLVIGAGQSLQFNDASTHSISITVPGTVTTGAISLPTADGTNGQVIQTNGTGQWSWVTQAGSGGVSTLGVTTGTVAGFSTVRSTPTSVINLNSSQFGVTPIAGATAYITLLPSSVTLQGNTFNQAGKLVQLNGSAQLPALDGSLLTGVVTTGILPHGSTEYWNYPSTGTFVDTNGGIIASTLTAINAIFDLSLPAGNCVQTGASGLLSTTGTGCLASSNSYTWTATQSFPANVLISSAGYAYFYNASNSNYVVPSYIHNSAGFGTDNNLTLYGGDLGVIVSSTFTSSYLAGGGTQCVQIDNSGKFTGTGSACISAGGGGSGPTGQINSASQYSVGYYSVTSSSNVISGVSPVAGNLVFTSSGTAGPPYWAAPNGGASGSITLISSGIAFGSTSNAVVSDTNSLTWNPSTEMMNVLAGAFSSLSIASGSYDSSMNKAGFVRVVKNYAFVAGVSSNTVTIFDVSSPTAPVRISQLKNGNLQGPEGMDVKWPYLYFVNFNANAFLIYNISSPANPIFVSSITDNTNLDEAEDVHVFGNYAYIVDFGGSPPSSPSVTIVDISTPSAPVIASSVTVASVSTPVQLLMDYPYAYLTGGNCNVFTINVADARAPFLASTYVVPGCVNRVVGADFYGRYLYLSGYTDNKFYVADISSPTAIVAVSTIATGTHTPWTLHTYGNKLFMTSINDNSILQYSLINPSTPTFINSLTDNNLLNTPDDLWMEGTQLYVTTHGTLFQGCGLAIINVGGIQTTTLQAGSAKVDNLQVDHEIDVGTLQVQNGIQTTQAGIGYLSMNKVRGAGLNTCGDSSHGVSFSQTTGQFGCQSITGTASSPGGSSGNIQYNNGGNFGGLSFLNASGTTVTDSGPGAFSFTGLGGIIIASGTKSTEVGNPISINWSGQSGNSNPIFPISFSGAGTSGQVGLGLSYLNPGNGAFGFVGSSITVDQNGNGAPVTALKLSAKNGSVNTALNIVSGDLELNSSGGTSGQCLQTQGAGSLPVWGSCGGSSGYNLQPATVTINANFGITVTTITVSSNTILANTTFYNGGLVTIGNTAIPAAPNDFLLQISSANTTPILQINNNGHLISSGTVPSAPTSCGSSPSMDNNSTDFWGTINVGSGVVTSCTFNPVSAFINSPVCVCSDDNSAVGCSVTSRSTTAVIFSLTATLGSGHIFYICGGAKG